MKLENMLNKAFKIKLVGLLIINLGVFIFMFHNAFLYKDTIAKVKEVENTFSHEEYGPNEEVEKYYEQNITALLLNGERKQDTITLSNIYSKSGVNDEKYKKGDQLFVSVNSRSEHGIILGKKRDVYLVILLMLFLSLLVLFHNWHGGMIISSLVINVSIFLLALWQYGKGKDLIHLAVVMMFVFVILTLIFSSGWHKKTLAAIISTFITTCLCYGIYEIVLHSSERLPYEMLEYVVNPDDLPELFLTGVLMGSLGAVMDVSISISAGVAELLAKTPNMKNETLIKSIREIGYDIMGTMINVLLFTYISGSIPILLVKIKNGYTLYHLTQFQMVFELIRFLMGAIGIVLAIPVAGLCSVFLLKGFRRFDKKEGN